MAKFFLGQKVRIVKSLVGNEGREGIVVEVGFSGEVEGFGFVESAVAVKVGGYVGWGPYYCYEPILPEGDKPSEFSFSELMDNLEVVVA